MLAGMLHHIPLSLFGKQCKQGPVHLFSRFPLRCNLRKLLVEAASPIPFERYLRYRLRIHSERSIQKEKPGLLKSVQVKIFHFWYSVFLFNPANEGTDLLQIFLSHRSHLLTQFTIWSVSIIHRSEKLCRCHIEI